MRVRIIATTEVLQMQNKHHIFASLSILMLGLVLLTLPQRSYSQSVHPKKEIFKSVRSWPVTSPGDVKLKNFSAFRAVYDRVYRQASGPDKGATRKDRVIISAEKTGWDGIPAISITIIDSGIPEKSDTNARVLTMFVGQEKLNTLFELGPIPGKAKDYYIGRMEKDMAYLSRITTDTQKLQSEKAPLKTPGFGPNAWVMASMELKKGVKISLGPSYSPPGNSLTSASYGHIVSQDTFTDGSGKKYKSWVLETSRNLSSPRVSHVHLIDRPPYYLGTETVNLDTGERRPFVWLKNVTVH